MMNTVRLKNGTNLPSNRLFGKCAAVIAALALVTGCGGGGEGGTGFGGGGGGGGTGGGANGVTGGGGSAGADGYVAGTNIAAPLAPAAITWLHNGTEDPQRAYWQQVASDFEALHPGVTVTVNAVSTQELQDTVLPQAIADGNAPDLFQSWGGGQLTELVNQGVTRDLSDVLSPTIPGLDANAVANWQVNGHSYGLPYATGPAGFWVNLNLLNEAGLVSDANLDAQGNVVSGTVNWPNDLDGLYSMWATLKDHGITPVAVGGGAGWPGPWWYYALATQLCSAQALADAGSMREFTDPCWEQAGTKLKQIVNQGAFNDNWGTTVDQGGADSSAGQVALGNAAMEFQGPWAGSVMRGIYQGQHGGDGTAADFISWYPFPSVEEGDHGAIMAGGDGFSVLDPSLGSQARSDAAAALLAYILSEQVQQQGLNFNLHGTDVVALAGIPTNSAAAAGITDPVLQRQAQTIANASREVPWLDVYFGTTIGSALNNAVNSLMRGQIGAGDVVAALNQAAGYH